VLLARQNTSVDFYRFLKNPTNYVLYCINSYLSCSKNAASGQNPVQQAPKKSNYSTKQKLPKQIYMAAVI
jgi:hypothetical protein